MCRILQMFAQIFGFVVPNTIFARTSEIVEILDAGSVFAHPRCTNVRSLRARCAKPPFCDADGDEADSYDDEGDARKTVLDPTFASIDVSAYVAHPTTVTRFEPRGAFLGVLAQAAGGFRLARLGPKAPSRGQGWSQSPRSSGRCPAEEQGRCEALGRRAHQDAQASAKAQGRSRARVGSPHGRCIPFLRGAELAHCHWGRTKGRPPCISALHQLR